MFIVTFVPYCSDVTQHDLMRSVYCILGLNIFDDVFTVCFADSFKNITLFYAFLLSQHEQFVEKLIQEVFLVA